MFEVPHEIEQPRASRIWIGVLAAALAVGGVVVYVLSGRSVLSRSANRGPAVAAPVAAPQSPADPVHDIKIVTAKMDKDTMGTTAVWLIDLVNHSHVYSYSHIEYEATYVGADNHALVINKGTIPITLQPGEEQNPEVRDVLFPAGTAWYKLRILGATSSVQ